MTKINKEYMKYGRLLFISRSCQNVKKAQAAYEQAMKWLVSKNAANDANMEFLVNYYKEHKVIRGAGSDY